jgi:hypothetical protein
MGARPESNIGAPCGHYWVFAIANGPISRGVGRLCQEVREFENSPSILSWGNGRTKRLPVRQSVDERVEALLRPRPRALGFHWQEEATWPF